MEELFQLADEEGRPLGAAPRSRCHRDRSLIHMVVHLHILDGAGRLFLQKRSAAKDLYPGVWDTAVGGHLHAGETVADALKREAREELGISAEGAGSARFLFSYLYRDQEETEYVNTFCMTHEGPFKLDPEEIEEGRFFTLEEIESRRANGFFTENLIQELDRLKAFGLFPAR